MFTRKNLLIIVSMTTGMLLFTAQATIYLTSNYRLKNAHPNLPQQIKGLLEQKVTEKVEILPEDLAKAEGRQKQLKSEAGNHYIFLFGWSKNDGGSTVFARSDVRFATYADIDKKKNHLLVIFIPLDDKMLRNIEYFKYVERLQRKTSYDESHKHRHYLWTKPEKLQELVPDIVKWMQSKITQKAQEEAALDPALQQLAASLDKMGQELK